ncbi:type II toxin-antitoxin system RelE/ParE family toxin [Altererythrobacter sp. Root672]|uniref:type II toxin-antitoxin system RelE/ParE family toxin n=1 Tax=Altererythrobacter sp. Root672 TaxID=1736584 RepID=UPI0006F42380|nr:type II toxin-antitoxin system RelE/ParE family toxin [Altererythrobacter sp. Root672]KRA82764.1 hypothetical protein ASD76_01345 [Altererythrobacter sp. Root672]
MPDGLDRPPFVSYIGQRFSLEQTDEFGGWLEGLRDTVGKSRIIKRLVRLSNGQFGDVRSLGDGVHELRMVFGPGYRVYFMLKGDVVILLLAGGDKDSQPRDIERAKQLSRSAIDGIED